MSTTKRRKTTVPSKDMLLKQPAGKDPLLQLPASTREWLVHFSPWIVIMTLIFVLPIAILALGLRNAVADNNSVVAIAAIFLEVGLLAASLPWLFKPKRRGWLMVTAVVVINLAHSIYIGHIASGVVVSVICLYFLIQVRPYFR